MTNGDGRHRGFIEALPFLAMLAGVAALVTLLIWLIENFGEK
jgi:hypothetical protein